MRNFWANRRVIVTGGSGFLGRRIVSQLHELNASFVFAPRREEFDLRINQDAERMIDRSRPDLIIHLAAVVGGIGANRKNPAGFFYDNLMMGVQLFDLAYRKGVEKFVVIGTVCSYPKFTPIPFQEENLWDGYPEETNAPYGLAKKMLIVQSDCYRRQYNFNSICLIPTNLYGPGDNFDPETSHVIPAIIMKCLDAIEQDKEEIVLWGSGKPTREFLYVDDCVEGILLGAERYDESSPVNLGAGREIAIEELAGMIMKLAGYRGRIRWDTAMPDGQPRRFVDPRRASRFGFKAKTSLEEGLAKTIDWYRNNQER